MEQQFFDLYQKQGCLALEVGHNSIADWNIVIYDKKNTALRDAKKVIHVEDCHRGLAFAKAYVELCDYLCETRGGY